MTSGFSTPWDAPLVPPFPFSYKDAEVPTHPYKQRRDTLAPISSLMDFSTNMNLKAVDHIDGRPAIRQLTSRRLGDLAVHECWGGSCTVELRPNAQAPVYKLPAREMLEGHYWRADFTLVPGRIIYDYLARPEADVRGGTEAENRGGRS